MLNAELGPGALGLEKHEFAHLECPGQAISTVPTSSIVEFATEHLIVQGVLWMKTAGFYF